MRCIWTRFSIWSIFVWSTLLLLLPQTLLAQEISCDSKLAADSTTLGYKIRGGGARCEGLYKSPVSSSLEIVGYRQGSSSLRSQRNIIKVSAPSLKQLAVKALNIRAEAIPLDTYYRMDAVIAESRPLTWPLNEVVIPAGISPDELGVFGWVQQEAGKVLVPVAVHPADRGGATETDKPSLVVIVRPAVNVEKILWRTFEENSAKRPEWQEPKRDRSPNGKFVSFVVPSGPSQIIGLELVARIHKKPGWEDPQVYRIYRVE